MLFKNLARPPPRLPQRLQRPIFRRQTLMLLAAVCFFIFITPTLFFRVSSASYERFPLRCHLALTLLAAQEAETAS